MMQRNVIRLYSLWSFVFLLNFFFSIFLIHQELDAFFKPEPYDVHPPEVRVWQSVSTQPIHFCYPANVSQVSASIGNWSATITSTVFLYLVAAMIATMATLGFDLWCAGGKLHFDLELGLLHLVGMVCNKLSNIRCIVHHRRLMPWCLLISIGLWWCIMIVTSSLQTRMTLIDDRDVAYDNLEHMLVTHRPACWFKGDKYLLYFSQAKPDSLFSRVWHSSNELNRCWLQKNLNSVHRLATFRHGCAIIPLMYMYACSCFDFQLHSQHFFSSFSF